MKGPARKEGDLLFIPIKVHETEGYDIGYQFLAQDEFAYSTCWRGFTIRPPWFVRWWMRWRFKKELVRHAHPRFSKYAKGPTA